MKIAKLRFLSAGMVSILLILLLYFSMRVGVPNAGDIAQRALNNISDDNSTGDLLRLNSTKKAIGVLGKGYPSINSEKSLEAKAAKELTLNRLAAADLTLMSDNLVYEFLIKKGAKIDSDMAKRMQAEAMTSQDREMVNIYFAQLFSEEENFKVEVEQYNNFDDMNDAFDKRTKASGVYYGNDLLKQPMAYRGIKFDDVKQLLDSGAVLPDDVMQHMIYSNNVDLAIALKNAGYNINVNYIDKYQSMNTIELQAERFVINPDLASAEEQINTIKKLVDIGVSVKVDDGTRDALDIVLGGVSNQGIDQAKILLSLAKSLHELGIPLEQSHFQLLANIRNKFPDLYSQYAQDFQ
jgi:hypothetical protein